MLTRIEIDGFKSFLDSGLDVPPFLALVGPNSSGKSNLLDALGFARAALLAGAPGMSPEGEPGAFVAPRQVRTCLSTVGQAI